MTAEYADGGRFDWAGKPEVREHDGRATIFDIRARGWRRLWAAAPFGRNSSSLKPFFGTYAGTSLMPSAEMLPRDLRVSIKPAAADGFTIEWQSTLFKYREAQRRKSQFVEFRPTTNDPSLYQAVPREGTGDGPGEATGDATGEMGPSATPLDGGPLAWAYVQGKTMSIHVLTIVENGGYVLQSYDRTLTRDGMNLYFARVRNGTVEQRLRGEFTRIDG